MAPPRKWTRQSWIDTAATMVTDGANLGEVKLQQLEANGAAKNSFYNNFPGGLPELHADVITWWKAQRVPAILEAALSAVQNPLEELRILRSVLAGNAVRDEAMRRWAVTDPDVAKAVTEGDKAIAGHALQALHEARLPGHRGRRLGRADRHRHPVSPATGLRNSPRQARHRIGSTTAVPECGRHRRGTGPRRARHRVSLMLPPLHRGLA